MIIFLYGPDDYRREEKKKECIEEFKKKHPSLLCDFFETSDIASLERFDYFVKAQSIFGIKKLAILENLFEDSDIAWGDFVRTVSGDPHTTILISESGKPPARFAFLIKEKKAPLSSSVMLQEFPHLEGLAWERFVDEETKKRDIVLSPEVRSLLISAYKNDSWGVVTELEKMSLLGKKRIEQNDVTNFNLEVTPDFWSLVQGLKGPDQGRRLATLEKCFSLNEPAAKLFHLLTSLSKGNPALYAEYDVAVKSGKMDYEEALVDLLIR